MNTNRQNIDRRGFLKRAGAVVGGLAIPAALRGQVSSSGTALSAARYPELKHINLAGNENPFGPSQKVSLTIMREVANSCRYPFREEEILKERLAALEGVQPENILLGNGCDEILSLAGDVYGKPLRNIVAARPTYLQLMHYAEKNGAHIKWVDHLESMHHDLPGMEAEVDEETTLMYICNPDTPSGTMLESKEVESCVRRVAERCPVFVDEVYLDMVEDHRARTQVGLVQEGLPVIIGRSFSKAHGLAGHRVGYAVAPVEIVKTMQAQKMSSLGYLGVMAALASLDDDPFRVTARRLIGEGRSRLCSLLEELKLPYTPSVCNFVFHYTGTEIREFQAAMKKRNLLVGRPFPPYSDWCRISIGKPSEMKVYHDALREYYA